MFRHHRCRLGSLTVRISEDTKQLCLSTHDSKPRATIRCEDSSIGFLELTLLAAIIATAAVEVAFEATTHGPAVLPALLKCCLSRGTRLATGRRRRSLYEPSHPSVILASGTQTPIPSKMVPQAVCRKSDCASPDANAVGAIRPAVVEADGERLADELSPVLHGIGIVVSRYLRKEASIGPRASDTASVEASLRRFVEVRARDASVDCCRNALA
ncbi:hypothetical protein DL766_001117 [Monosporascus sp. MC13-8B]|uniref:Uncharacterized protein n=1 Tax=Monosporascus cannonballus TaxID=155416 RepID=A0ABY0HAF9_9PEZI|nr:hypothetical protein DL762_004526 [Monosporascus cannonballus]RYO90539.1 hypothetical protein DL763_005304 [Monosporascus cannonballus]RYP38207.1 hypothetical protein DL766_001117 [Monosporascus sp. MC13-8B]